MNRALARRAVSVVAAATAAAPLALIGTAAHATLPGTNGQITYSNSSGTYVANADGSSPRLLPGARNASFAPDGSRIAYVATNGTGIWSVRADGSQPVRVTENATDDEPVFSSAGSRVIYTQQGRLRFAASRGGWWNGEVNENPDPLKYTDLHPTVAPNNNIAFERRQAGADPAIYRYSYVESQTIALVVAKGAEPDYSPDGTKIAYVVPGAQAADAQVWIANADGSGATQLTTDAAGATTPKWSPDGASLLFTQATGSGAWPLKRINVGTKEVTPVVSDGRRTAWQPVRKNLVERVWGNDALDTAVGTSQWNYADFGASDPIRVPAKAVVLSRSDTYLDALAGSALAVNKQAPLLITPRSGLDLRIQAEIKRVLGTSGTIYILGGTFAMPQPIEDKLRSLGYTTQRIWGGTYFDTAIAIDREITQGAAPKIAIVSTGAQFYDALAAGAAAGANPGTVIVLTDGDNLPNESAAYLNSLNPNPDTGTLMVAGGGPGARALDGGFLRGQMPSWGDTFRRYQLIGQNEKDTALLLADFFFASPTVAAVATNRTWEDALTGGAMIGANYGPLLLTESNALYGPVGTYLSNHSAGMWEGVMLGGWFALSDDLRAPIGEAISLPGQWEYRSFQPVLPDPGGRGLKAPERSAPQGPGSRKTEGTPPGVSRGQAKPIR